MSVNGYDDKLMHVCRQGEDNMSCTSRCSLCRVDHLLAVSNDEAGFHVTGTSNTWSIISEHMHSYSEIVIKPQCKDSI